MGCVGVSRRDARSAPTHPRTTTIRNQAKTLSRAATLPQRPCSLTEGHPLAKPLEKHLKTKSPKGTLGAQTLEAQPLGSTQPLARRDSTQPLEAPNLNRRWRTQTG